ncbi:MAG: peptidoglycan bridge formation glycyltransferase FemA/FemB family protein [Nocardioides sp.]
MIVVRPLTPEQHLEFLRSRDSASFLQTPAWAKVKPEWRAESLGWFRGDELIGAGLVLHRQLPKIKRSLAYLPEGPVLDWDLDDLKPLLDPMVRHLKKQGAFAVRMGPPVITRRWSAAQVKEGIANPEVRRLGEIAPLERTPVGARVVSQLHELGWKPQAVEGGFAAGQPQYNFVIPLAGRTEDDVLKGMNQLWRRNIKKAAKEGVVVTRGFETLANARSSTTGAAAPVDQGTARLETTGAGLKAFHDLYVHTAERDHFTPRPLSYFQTMLDALGAEDPSRITLWFAHHEGDLVASTIAIRVGTHAWYSYGASSTEKREVRGSNAIQWEMIRDALANGCAVYDLRGITDTLDAEDSHVGLIQFKVGTGGEAVEYVGEWDLPINRVLYKAFELYMARR